MSRLHCILADKYMMFTTGFYVELLNFAKFDLMNLMKKFLLNIE